MGPVLGFPEDKWLLQGTLEGAGRKDIVECSKEKGCFLFLFFLFIVCFIWRGTKPLLALIIVTGVLDIASTGVPE